MADAAWSPFFDLLFFKAAEAGRTVVKVNPACTSQTCSHCGRRQPLPLEQRLVCVSVLSGHPGDRDLNAARDMLALGLSSAWELPPKKPPPSGVGSSHKNKCYSLTVEKSVRRGREESRTRREGVRTIS
ncbi:zinc ribbon domain-containing protein [Thermogemmatispora sp.]|uniref:zinc ribbon domain-containing protein n=1 Tax=Thermogemmatispora sp. TaxID=1968838 RepID=UPI003A0FD1BA